MLFRINPCFPFKNARLLKRGLDPQRDSVGEAGNGGSRVAHLPYQFSLQIRGDRAVAGEGRQAGQRANGKRRKGGLSITVRLLEIFKTAVFASSFLGQ